MKTKSNSSGHSEINLVLVERIMLARLGLRALNQQRAWALSKVKIFTNGRTESTAPTTSTSTTQPIQDPKSGLILEQPDPNEPKKPSFAKQLFLGRFDTDVLTFPEVLKKEEHETLHEMVNLVEKYFEDKGKIYLFVIQALLGFVTKPSFQWIQRKLTSMPRFRTMFCRA